MPIFASCVPRTMLPPPMTTPTDAPTRETLQTSSASRSIVSKSNPYPFSPASASPESLISTLGYLSSGRLRLADLKPDEPPHLDVLARFAGQLLHELAYGLLVVAYPGLIEQRDILVEGLDLSFDDLVDEMRGLPALLDLLGEDPALVRDLVRRDLILVDRDRRRWRSGDMLGDRLHELLEVVRARDEVRLAIHLDEHAKLAVVMDVGADEAFARSATRSLVGLGGPALPEELDCRFHVTIRLFERFLAIHHARAGALPQLRNFFRANRLRSHVSVLHSWKRRRDIPPAIKAIH